MMLTKDIATQKLHPHNNNYYSNNSNNAHYRLAMRKSGHLQPPFDPIPRSSAGNNSTPTSAAVAGSTKFGHRASASPSIASLINADPPAKKPRTSGAQPTSNFVEDPNGNNSSTSSTNNNKRLKKEGTENSPMLKAATTTNTTTNNNTSTANSSKAPSPKPARQAGSGGGLLGNALPGMGGGNQDDEFRVPNIYLNFPLEGETNRYIDFAKLAEEKYGWAALNPRLAKAKMMMDSGDEMAVDGSESESNVEMGGTGEAASESSKQRKKRRYQDIYDKEDPFIDDSEMMWEEQAASSKDGFFVYSGPLVPEGEKPLIERADGTVKRGRGRGRGGRGGGTATTRAPATTARKPRITKKEKEKLEKEKEERERYALAVAQSKDVHPH
ncbi:hypothetical protein BZA05DRAFT_465947 [Tricharina praecox]|uniref:uncharacterized protein n=1 Tax=Tricharina praecox TaxID=43433 RepID=UPI00221FBC8B|nr:uncharacterized protein BZA05DRAFT_465947 [Tricharina praecox]KAI5855241.1 hypothetical protein BZA05DRAFT_465947 [Tricharina praecox]